MGLVILLVRGASQTGRTALEFIGSLSLVLDFAGLVASFGLVIAVVVPAAVFELVLEAAAVPFVRGASQTDDGVLLLDGSLSVEEGRGRNAPVVELGVCNPPVLDGNASGLRFVPLKACVVFWPGAPGTPQFFASLPGSPSVLVRAELADVGLVRLV